MCYVEDLVDGLWRLLSSDLIGPVNLGNPQEVTIDQLAELIRTLAKSSSAVVYVERPVDDPSVRCPDISLARRALGWEPRVPLEEGLARTIAWAGRQGWGRGSATQPEG